MFEKQHHFHICTHLSSCLQRHKVFVESRVCNWQKVVEYTSQFPCPMTDRHSSPAEYFASPGFIQICLFKPSSCKLSFHRISFLLKAVSKILEIFFCNFMKKSNVQNQLVLIIRVKLCVRVTSDCEATYSVASLTCKRQVHTIVVVRALLKLATLSQHGADITANAKRA